MRGWTGYPLPGGLGLHMHPPWGTLLSRARPAQAVGWFGFYFRLSFSFSFFSMGVIGRDIYYDGTEETWIGEGERGIGFYFDFSFSFFLSLISPTVP